MSHPSSRPSRLPWPLLLLAAAVAALPAAADWPMLARDPARSGSTSDEVRPPFARKWYRAFPDEGLHAGVQPVIVGKRLFIGTLRGIVRAIDTDTGQDVWSFRAGGPILHACASDGQRVFFGAGDGFVLAVSAADGRPVWAYPTGVAVWNAPLVHQGVVYVGGRDGKLHAIDAATGKARWAAPAGGPILNSPALDARAGRVYVGAEDMHVYAFDTASGKVAWVSPKLPGASFRGYHPVVAPDGSVLVTVTPHAGGDAIQEVLLDMVKEVFGDFASWRIKDPERKKQIRAENFALMQRPETYRKQLDYLRKRLADEPALQTYFVLDPATGKPKFVAPIVYAESMNGPAAPPVVTPDGKRVIVKFSALLRSRYEHYSPFLNVGYLDTATGHIEPAMDESRTYGWHDSLLLVHDEQSQLAVGGKVLVNTHQDNVNALDLATKKGYEQAWAHNVHEVKGGAAAAIWAEHLAGRSLPQGWEWFARGTAVYGGGSAIDVPVVIDGDSFYWLPTHELNAGCALIAYRMDRAGKSSQRAPQPSTKLTDEQWKRVQALKWDWDMLDMPRLNVTFEGLPGAVEGTRRKPRPRDPNPAGQPRAEILDRGPRLLTPPPSPEADAVRARLAAAVEELISRRWRPLVLPAGKHPAEAIRFFVEPTETLYTLALAYPHLPKDVQGRVRAHVDALAADGTLWRRTYDPAAGEGRSAYDVAPDRLLRLDDDLVRSDTARLYPLWLWAEVTGDWGLVRKEWPRLVKMVRAETDKGEADCGNGRVSGLLTAYWIAIELQDVASADRFLPLAAAALHERRQYELRHPEGGIVTQHKSRTTFGRWRFLNPHLARHLRDDRLHRHLLDVYVDHHRPSWFVAWSPELLWRNENSFSLPTMSLEVFHAKALLGRATGQELLPRVDIPWCKADEAYVQKLALVLHAWQATP